MKDTFEEVVEFIQSKTGLESKPLDRSTRLHEDLRIAGDDAFELMSEYRDVFQVDMSGFDHNDYFGPEGVNVVGAFVSLFKRKKTLKIYYSWGFRAICYSWVLDAWLKVSCFSNTNKCC